MTTRDRARARYVQVEPGDTLYIKLLVWFHNRCMDLAEWCRANGTAL